MRDEIQFKWGKFNAEEIAAFKNNAGLVAQPQGDVDAFARGRQLYSPA